MYISYLRTCYMKYTLRFRLPSSGCQCTLYLDRLAEQTAHTGSVGGRIIAAAAVADPFTHADQEYRREREEKIDKKRAEKVLRSMYLFLLRTQSHCVGCQKEEVWKKKKKIPIFNVQWKKKI